MIVKFKLIKTLNKGLYKIGKWFREHSKETLKHIK